MEQEIPDSNDMKNGLSKELIKAIKLYNSVSNLEEINPNSALEEIREKLSHAFSCADAATCALQHIESELNKLIE